MQVASLQEKRSGDVTIFLLGTLFLKRQLFLSAVGAGAVLLPGIAAGAPILRRPFERSEQFDRTAEALGYSSILSPDGKTVLFQSKRAPLSSRAHPLCTNPLVRGKGPLDDCPPPTNGNGPDGYPIDSGMMIIGYVQARTIFPPTVDYSTDPSYQAYNYTGPAGPLLALSPIYKMPATKLAECIIARSAVAINAINSILGWVKKEVNTGKIAPKVFLETQLKPDQWN